MKLIFLLHDDLRVKLFAQIANKALQKNIEVNFLCYSIACKKSISACGFKKHSSLVHDNNHFLDIIHDDELEKSIDVIASFLSLASARKVASATYFNISNLTKNKKEDFYIFGGNGLHVFDKVAKHFAETQRNIYTVFTELANIEGKTFFDAKGSNSSSLFYQLLKHNKLNLNKTEQLEGFYSWRNAYCNKKLKHHYVPQTKQFSRLDNIVHRGYGFFELFFGIGSYQKHKLLDFLSKRGSIAKKSYGDAWLPWIDKNIPSCDYNFFPLQVFSDSQIKLHSKINVEQALLKAIKTTQREGRVLVVKPHPAEFDSRVINRILKLKQEHGFLLSNDNTFKLIQLSKKVIVINSTVGLESILLGKPVEFLGETFYTFLTEDTAMNYYINDWLMGLDMFNPEPLQNEDFDKIINIARMKSI